MSSSTNESENGVHSKDNPNSPSFDEGSFGGSLGGETTLKKGPWTSAEDAILVDYVNKHGEGNWNAVQKFSGLSRCGKSCRLRWANHLRPNLKKGAFTAEEECLIVELHAKMGNKWARMAAHLPGRTDNEIKNYWNTRVKRRHRAGLPLYPQELCLQVLRENQQTQHTDEFNHGDVQHLMQDCLVFPEIKFNNLNRNQDVMAYAPQFPDFPIGNMLNQGPGPSQIFSLRSGIMHQPKRLRGEEILFSGFNGSITDRLEYQNDTHLKTHQHYRLPFQYDPDAIGKIPSTFGMMHGSHILTTDNISSSKPLFESLKLELPSIQHPESGLGCWEMPSSPTPSPASVDAFIQSPPSSTRMTQSDCGSPRNSGMLDAVLQESHTLSCQKNQSSEKSSNSSAVTPDAADSSLLNLREIGWEEYSDPVSPLGRSAASLINEHTPLSGSPSDDCPATKIPSGLEVKQEPNELVFTPDEDRRGPTQLSFQRPDALLDGGFYGQIFHHAEEQSNPSEFISPYIGEDIWDDYKQTSAESASPSQGWDIQTFSWNNYSPVYQMSQLL